MIRFIGLEVSPTKTSHQGMTLRHIISRVPPEKLFTLFVFGANVSIDLLDAALIDSLTSPTTTASTNSPSSSQPRRMRDRAQVDRRLSAYLLEAGADVNVVETDGELSAHLTGKWPSGREGCKSV